MILQVIVQSTKKKDKKIVQEGSGDPIAWYFIVHGQKNVMWLPENSLTPKLQ